MLLRLTTALAFAASFATAQTNLPSLEHQGIAPRIEALDAAAPDTQMELAFLKSLRALEKAAQTQTRQALGNGLSNIPFLNFAPRNPYAPFSPRPTPDAIRSISQTLIADLDSARSALDAISDPSAAEFVLNAEHLWFDFDQNGGRGKDETVTTAMRPILGRRAMQIAKEQAKANGAPIIIRFDEADIYWLTAYTHILSAMAHMVLAFDPTPIIEDLEKSRATLADAPTILPFEDLTSVRRDIAKLKEAQTKLKAKAKELSAEVKPLQSVSQQIYKDIRASQDPARIATLKAEQAEIKSKIETLTSAQRKQRAEQRWNRAEISSLEAKLPADPKKRNRNSMRSYEPIIDSIYILFEVLRQDPDKFHLDRARVHWAEMIQSNQKFWQVVALETDNNREWVPNAQQTSALGITLATETMQTWQNILKEADAVVQGKLLIPHPLLPDGMGISLKDYFETPAPLDILGWFQGRSAYPYARHGQRMSSTSWQRLQRLSNGSASLFAIFLN